jgi:threonine aldolase
MRRSFASDNNAGVHPAIFAALQNVNVGHAIGYGDDAYTRRAEAKFQEHFGENTDVFFVFGGTAANVLGLKAATQSYHAVLCAETAHINVDECGAPEHIIGCKLVAIPTPDGKITVEQIQGRMHGVGDQHHVQPKVISISQPTELGTLYSPQEIRGLADYAHQHDLVLHMDGARIANAAASLGVTLADITRHAGVDILSFGGTKNGMMYGEAVILFDRRYAANFRFIRKQGMQLASKMRFIAAQFETLLANDLWLRNAMHANAMARQLATSAAVIPGVTITQNVQSNAVFAVMPHDCIARLQEHYFFYVWDEPRGEVRWMTSFDTTEADVRHFVSCITEVTKAS